MQQTASGSTQHPIGFVIWNLKFNLFAKVNQTPATLRENLYHETLTKPEAEPGKPGFFISRKSFLNTLNVYCTMVR